MVRVLLTVSAGKIFILPGLALMLNSPILCYHAIQRSSCGLKMLPQEVLAFRKFYRKEDLAVLTSNRKEVLVACRI